MSTSKLKDLLTRTIVLHEDSSKHISEYIKMISVDIDRIVELFKVEYDIETSRDELMMDIQRIDSINPTTKQPEFTFQLVVRPTQDLLRKFEKNFPELVI